MNKRHYVYRITNTKLNKHYYGTRTTGISPCKDLGIKYYSSSSDTQFREDQKNNPQHYKYTIVSEFDSREAAMRLEIKLHDKFDVGINESFYNKCKATTTGFDVTGSKEIGRKISEILKGRANTWGDKISESLKDYVKTEEHRLNISKANKGRVSTFKGKSHTEEAKSKMSKVHKGKTISNEQKEMISKQFKGKKQTIIECPHCNKKGGAPGMKRYHFDNCKMKLS